MEFMNVDREALFDEIVEKGREEGITDEGAYRDLVDDIVETHRRVGEMHDDSSIVSLSENMVARFAEYLERLGEEPEQV